MMRTGAELYDVVIVGAGPVGSYVAYRLAKLGYKVTVLERRARIGDTVCCTGIIGKECFDQFPIVNNGVLTEYSSAKFFSPSGKCLSLSRDTVQAYVVDRAAFDRALAQKAQEQGVDYLLSARVHDIILGDNFVRVVVEYGDETRNFDGRMAVISSGFGTSLPQRLGLGKITDFVLGAQAEVNVKGVEGVEVYFGQETAPGFFGWLVPTVAGKALAGLLSRRSPGSYLRNFLSSLLARGKIASTETNITYGGIPLNPRPKTCWERIVVVGDAAGQVKPTTGGGIYYGLLCADIAAEVMHAALRSGDFSAKRMSYYERDWRKKLSRELQIGYWARKTYERLDDRQIENIF
ncbi:MAG TPA: NAD(P)/FAD-dependent oxidoreductase, partial [Dehalococcoidia bacterium]|nr:NAD(P)/FAD-dependent oxidoreductase [Dehalococcoidia bacterium]